MTKKQATRVNPKSPLESFVPRLGDKNPSRYVRGGPVLMPKDPNAVQPANSSVWERETYKPPSFASVREGGDDHRAHKSRGIG
jgi:hypothetical protein